MWITFVDRSPTAYYIRSLLPTRNTRRAVQSQSLPFSPSPQGFQFTNWNSHGAPALFFESTLAGGADEIVSGTFRVAKPNRKDCTSNHVDPVQTTVPGPQHEVREKRQRTVGKIASSIAGHFGPAYRIEAFGSTQYGVDGLTSDLDLVIIVGTPFMPHL